jgi:hypothetical protein
MGIPSPPCQAITAAGSGCMAALAAERYLVANDLLREFKLPDSAYDGHEPSGSGHAEGGNGNGHASQVGGGTGVVGLRVEEGGAVLCCNCPAAAAARACCWHPLHLCLTDRHRCPPRSLQAAATSTSISSSSASSSSASAADSPDTFDVSKDKHKGQ